MASVRRAVLMGSPEFFSIRGGANPHTRNTLGLRKRVSRELAVRQWHAFASLLVGHGVEVFVVPADPAWPGLVYPANAGALVPLEEPLPVSAKRFTLSNLIASRAGEKAIYRTVLSRLGFSPVEITSRFEGEADFFPVGLDLYLFTFGALERQRFVPRLGLPPWRRLYGFRTDRSALAELSPLVPGREVLPLELRDEAYYHGDTCLAAFGPDRHFVLAWLEALTPASREALVRRLGDRLLPLTAEDAAIYAANCFRLADESGERLFLPAGISGRLAEEIRARGVEPVTVDVSEFWRKGGGSVKCMIGDLGPLDAPPSEEAAGWRAHYRLATRPAVDRAPSIEVTPP
ncbi:MAG: dimethylarginine dimethylaminohydrolase family protein [Candidatus Binatia bacterium]